MSPYRLCLSLMLVFTYHRPRPIFPIRWAVVAVILLGLLFCIQISLFQLLVPFSLPRQSHFSLSAPLFHQRSLPSPSFPHFFGSIHFSCLVCHSHSLWLLILSQGRSNLQAEIQCKPEMSSFLVAGAKCLMGCTSGVSCPGGGGRTPSVGHRPPTCSLAPCCTRCMGIPHTCCTRCTSTALP